MFACQNDEQGKLNYSQSPLQADFIEIYCSSIDFLLFDKVTLIQKFQSKPV